MSEFIVEVVKIKKEIHPNADLLALVKVRGYQVVVRSADWKDGDLAAYVPPDSVVPDKAEYAFLDGHLRIKARRFRGLWSFGLLMPAPRGSKPGDNVAEVMGITHYEPPLCGRGMTEHAADFAKAPTLTGPIYDVENILRYNEEFTPDMVVVITEKLHGANIRMTYQNGQFHVASRRFFRKEFHKPKPKNWWEKIKFWFIENVGNNDLSIPSSSEYWRTFKANPKLMDVVRKHESLVFYGELYGNTQAHFPYDSGLFVDEGVNYNELAGYNKIRIFDILDPTTRKYLSWYEVTNIVPGEYLVPVDYIGPFSMDRVQRFAEKPSQLTNAHIREGVVVKPVDDVWSDRIGGRLILKYVNPKYLES